MLPVTTSLDLTFSAYDIKIPLPTIDLCDLRVFDCPFNDTAAAFNSTLPHHMKSPNRFAYTVISLEFDSFWV
jgi:hypothetical protein